ncbi:MAG: hypothetical protein ABL959_00190 [Pyrinomonadaceae bacterium]
MTSTLEPQRQFDPTLQSEDIAFAQSELIECKTCSRKNAPDRSSCIYCGKDLENANATKLTLRKLESWEPSFSVIARRFTAEPSSLNAIAALLGIEKERFSEMAEAKESLPLCRVESLGTAESIASRIADHGGECIVLADTDLQPEKPPIRLKRIDLDIDEIAFVDFNTDDVYRLMPSDISLVVTGRFITSRTDVLEKKRRGGKSDLLNETSTSSDESVADIYSKDSPFGFRIRLSGFDFSCLGSERQLVAAQNFRLLIERLRTVATNASVVDYLPIRHFLDDVWEPESRKDALGRKSAGLGKKGFGSVATTSNIIQFTKFSRMHWHLLSSI